MACPKNEAEFRAYFFELIGRAEGSPANDFEAVMAKEYPWNGQMLKIPENLPGPDQQLPADAPFYGLTQQVSGGKSSGRVWIPAANPVTDENGNNWYTRYFQIIEDKPGGFHGIDFLWTWWYQNGNEYVPICDGSDNGSVPPGSDLEARVETLEAQYALLEERVNALESIKDARKKVALRNIATGQFVAAEAASSKVLVANRNDAGAWEQFEIVPLP
jgi:hypothetical protein